MNFDKKVRSLLRIGLTWEYPPYGVMLQRKCTPSLALHDWLRGKQTVLHGVHHEGVHFLRFH